jgi:HipA-like protein
MIKVWTDAAEAGTLDRYDERGSTFAYRHEAAAGRAVSVTMPVRLPSWNVNFGLPPIFDMNLPEGFLRERLRLAFAKATGTFDDFDLLSIVGRSQMAGYDTPAIGKACKNRCLFNRSMRFSRAVGAAISSDTCLRNSPPSPALAAFSPRSSCAMKAPSIRAAA